MQGGWRLGFWIATVLSGLWFLLATAASIFMLFVAADERGRLHERTIPELVLGVIVVLQPILIGAMITRAFRRRDVGSAAHRIRRAALPMSTILILILAQILHNYNEDIIHKKWALQRQTGTITYNCSAYSEAVDFNVDTIGSIGLQLISARGEGRDHPTWFLAWPGEPPIVARNFEASTGSIGGSQGLMWLNSKGEYMSAHLSFSDIVGAHGPQTIWLTVNPGTKTGIQDKLAAGEMLRYTCGPDESSYRPATQASGRFPPHSCRLQAFQLSPRAAIG